MILKPDPNSFKILPPEYDPGHRKNARLFCDLYEGNTSKNQDTIEIQEELHTKHLKNYQNLD